MKKYINKVISILVVFCLVMQYVPPISFASESDINLIKAGNAFIKYHIDKTDGRFTIKTNKGLPYKDSDDNKKLMFERFNNPETSYTTFKIDGKDYIYGNNYSNSSGLADNFQVTNNGLKTQSNWQIDGISITQTLEIVEDPDHPNIGNVKIKYDVVNNTTTPKQVGNRILLDTQVGDNDGASFKVHGATINTETEYLKDEIPDFYQTYDKDFAPSTIGYGFVKGFAQLNPDRVVFAHYNTLSGDKWDVNIDNSLIFTSNDNKYSGADSAVAYYYNEAPLAANETKSYVTYYGLGDFSHYDSNSPYQVTVNMPSKLTVNSAKTKYNEDTIKVSVTIDNSLSTSENLTNVNIKLGMRDLIFKPVDGEEYSKNIAQIEKNEVTVVEFEIEPVEQAKYISEPITVNVTSDNNETGVSNFAYTLLPSIKGEKPNVTLETISPKYVYYQGYREINLTGTGFNILKNSNIWKLFLVNNVTNEEILIDDKYITINNDENITVTITDDEVVTNKGLYTVYLKVNDLGDINANDTKVVYITDKIKYKSRSYGVLYVEKTSGNNYYIKTTDSLQKLRQIKQSKEIVLDIVGDIIEKTDSSNNPYYIIKTDTKNAVINSVVEYKDASKPIKVQKKNDLITLEGDGTLQIVNNNEFWWWNFYTNIKDGIDYNTQEISEDSYNVTIDFFNPLNIIGKAANTIYDGFNLEIKDVILLDEGASFGGKIEVEVPYGADVPAEEDEEEDEDTINDIILEALSDLFLSDDEKSTKYEKEEKFNVRVEAAVKIQGLLFNDDAIYSSIVSLVNSSSDTPVQKANKIMELIAQSPDLLATIYTCVKGEEDDDEDKKSVGVTIDVKKVLFGKKYSDHMYQSVKYIGLEAEGEVNVALPFGTEEDREEADFQGVKAAVAIDTIKGEYSFEASANLEICEASAIVSIVKVNNELRPDRIKLEAGYDPGIPLISPLFINKVGGEVNNLAGKDDSEPLNVIIILGLNLKPKMEGEFTAQISKNGFAMNGSFEFKNGLKILKEVGVELQWTKPVYFQASATVELFEIIEGSASLYIGQKNCGDNSYKFFFEGKASVSITIPEDVMLVGGKELAQAALGISTEKIWGSIEVIGIGVGVTYVYGKDVDFDVRWSDQNIDYISLTNVLADEVGIDEKLVEDGKLVFGSNIKKVAESNKSYAESSASNIMIISNENKTSYDITLDNTNDALLEIEYTGLLPQLSMLTPDGSSYELIEDINYMTKVVSKKIPNGELLVDKYIYISILDPKNGTWVLSSDSSLDSVSLYNCKPIPKLSSINYIKNNNDLTVNFTAKNAEDALVTIFMVDSNNPESAGLALASNINATDGHVSTVIPSNIPEGQYFIRATIQHPNYGYHEIKSDTTFEVVDLQKPQFVSNIVVKNIGNGLLEASFNKIDDDGDISYFVTVYNENNVPVSGYKDIKTQSNKLIFGGSYSALDINNNPVNYVMENNKSYKIGIITVKKLTVSENESLHYSNEVYSNSFIKREPQPPVISNSLNCDYITLNGKKYINVSNPVLNIHSNQSSVMTIYLDNELYLKFNNNNSVEVPFNLVDGEHIVEIECINQYNDKSKEVVDFVIDTTKPELFIDTPSNSFIATSNNVEVKGSTEFGSSVYINDIQVTTNSKGEFIKNISLDEAKLKSTINIKAIDSVGNITDYSSEVINGQVKPFEKIIISDLSSDLCPGAVIELLVVAIDSENNSVVLDNDDISFSVIKGDSLCNITSSGELTVYDTGKITVLASYGLTPEYALEDAINIDVDFDFTSILITPEINTLKISQSVELETMGVTKYQEIKLNNDNITYEIVSGHENVTLIGNKLTAKKSGNVTIRARYEDEFKTLETTINIYVKSNSVYKPSSNKKHNTISDTLEAQEIENISEILTGVWANLLEKEHNIEIISARKIPANSESNITLKDIGKLEIQEGTIKIDDVFLSAVVKNPNQLIEDDSYQLMGDIYELTFKSAGGKLNKAIKLRLLLGGNTNNSTGIYVYNEIFNKWQYIGGVIEEDEISTYLNHLSKYAVLEDIRKDQLKDINGNWAERLIRALDSLGIVSGEKSGGYRYYVPNRNISRLELAAFVIRIYEKIHGVDETKVDVDISEIYTDYKDIRWGQSCAKKLYQYGLFEGDVIKGKRYFNPKTISSRAETIAIISKAIGLKPAPSAEFIDSKDIPDWAVEHINHLVDLGFIGGYTDGTIKPNNKITRAEMAKIFYFWIEYEVMKLKE